MILLKLTSRSTTKLFRLPLTIKQSAGISSVIKTGSKPPEKETGWETIYKFNLMKFLVTFNQLKKYQIIGTGVIVPASFAIETLAIEGVESLPLVTSAIGISGLLALSLASWAFKGTIGFIYTQENVPELVRFAYLDFWGIRRDVEMKIENVLPFSEIPRSRLDQFYTTLRFQDGHPKLKLFYKHGGVIDYSELDRIFGSD